MRATPKGIINTYIALSLLSTLATSFIWGINTLFLLNAGLSITEAFAANAFFTVGQVLFEIPTGVVADTAGRRLSYLLGTFTLFVSTLLYLYLWQIQGPFVWWAISSVLLGLGFTFFSGATEAWLVDGLKATRFDGTLESAFAKGQIATGAAMLCGAVAGGVIAQSTNLGVPYILRAIVLALTFITALFMMHDIGFTPRKSKHVVAEIKEILKASWRFGLKKPAVRWVMISGAFTGGVLVYAFYAMQPYLLQLWGSESYAIAGLAAAIVAGAQIFGGFTVPVVRKIFRKRTSALSFNVVAGAVVLAAIGLISNFWIVLVLLAFWGILFAATVPIRQTFLNEQIPSEQRATVLSFDNLIWSAGSVVSQPTLGKVADVWSYSASYLVGAAFELFALPFILLARKIHSSSDDIK